MSESSKEWRKQYDVKNENHVSFSPNNPEDGPGGYFIGFDGRKTKYIGLTPEEQKDWLIQGQENPNFQKDIDSLIQNGNEIEL